MADLLRLTPETLEFVLLSFEGPDQYSMAGGLGVRMKELALELARQGYKTHLVFIGDPDLPARETPVENLTLHRWGQWLSAHYRGGVYQGEESKLIDWNEQLPGYVLTEMVGPAIAAGRLTAILAEEWHTAYSTCQISDRLWTEGVRNKAILLWNANNTIGFDRIDWRRLDFCSQVTTVSRYMKHVMWDLAINPLVIPNGIPGDRIQRADAEMVAHLRSAFAGREVVFKIGRFSPDKRWHMAIDALAEEKRAGHDIATVIRGGVEPHGAEVLARAYGKGLQVVDVKPPRNPAEALRALAEVPKADVYNITSFMSDELINVFYTGADAVLANSGHEPFGLVGLEVMAAGGITFVGTTGEDYAVPFLNCIALDTDDPTEINIGLDFLRRHPHIVERMRNDAMETAESFSWKNVVEDNLLGKLRYVAMRQLVTPPGKSRVTPAPAAPVTPPTAEAAKAAAKRSKTASGVEGPVPAEAESLGGSVAHGEGGPASGDAARPSVTGAAGGGSARKGAGPTDAANAKAAAETPNEPQAPDGTSGLPYGGAAMTKRPSIKPRSSEG